MTAPAALHAQDGGPWTPRQAGGYLNASFSYWGYDKVQLINPDSGRTGNLLRPVTDMTFCVSAVYGATDRVSIIASIPLKIISTSQSYNDKSDFTDTLKSGRVTSLGNVNVGVKYKFYHKKWVMAASLTSELKTGLYDSKTGLRTAYDAWGFVPMFHIGRSWKEKYYLSMDLGGCYRTDNYSGDWRIGLETGAHFFNALWLRLNVDSRRSFRNGSFMSANNQQTSLYVNDQEWLALQFKVEYQHPIGFGIQAGISGYFAGNNIPNAPYFFGGLYYKWNYDLNDVPKYRIEDRPKQ
jgi:hypothetical protein